MAILTTSRWSSLILLAALGGCATTPSGGGETAFREAQRAAAARAEEAGDPAQALRYWRSLQTLAPQDPDIATKVAQLETQVERQARARLATGVKRFSEGDTARGNRAMLSALALQPDSDEALKLLRESVSNAAHEQQEEKVASEYEREEEPEEQQVAQELEILLSEGRYQTVLERAESVDDENERNLLVLRAHTGLADAARRKGRREAELGHLTSAISLGGGEELTRRRKALARELSDEAYRDGLARMQSDLPEAIQSLERAVNYDPDNLAAKEKLDQAMVIKKNLDRIRAN